MEALPVHGWQYTLDFHRVYGELAEQYQLTLVPFLLMNVLGRESLMSADGVHPNAAGARVIADTVLTYLKPLAESVAGASKSATR
jgi:acyl-CoA thioesterase-1